MSRPYVSVCMPTMRVGGLDVVLAGLRGQTFRDFELCVADAFPWRWERCRDEIARASEGLAVKWAAPEPNPFPVNSFCAFANAALALAEGEVVVFITDYTWLAPDNLARHAEHHRRNPGDLVGMMSPHQYVAFPSRHPDFPSYKHASEDDTERYAADATSGRLDAFGLSVFERPFDADPRTMPLCPEQANADPKLALPIGETHPYGFHGKNESAKLARVRQVGGWNAELDGTHGWQDSEMADALQLVWHLEPTNVAYIVNPRSHFPHARRLRDYWTNEPIWRRHDRGRAV